MLRVPTAKASTPASRDVTRGLGVLPGHSSEASQVSTTGQHIFFAALTHTEGPTGGSGNCYYKFAAGAYYLNSTVYAAANLISNGTPQLPVGYKPSHRSLSANRRLKSAHTIMERPTVPVTAQFTRYIAVSIPAQQKFIPPRQDRQT